MGKTPETYQKVAETYTKMGDKHWAKSKDQNLPEEKRQKEYLDSQKCYGTAAKAKN